MGVNSEPFTPTTTGTVSRSITGTSANVALAKTSVPQTIMVTAPPANAIAFIEFGTASTVSAVAATGTPILPGAIMVFSVGPDISYVAAIGTSGSTLYFTCGHGQ